MQSLRASRSGKLQGSDMDPYASEQVSAELLAHGRASRLRRLSEADMVGTEQAAVLAGATPATIRAWIESGRCIGLERTKRGWRLPAWQFELPVFGKLQAISDALGTTDGWALLAFLETPQGGLDGLTPRQALERGLSERVVAVAGRH
jgi:hypothetical protein